MNSTRTSDLEHLRSFRQSLLDLIWWWDNVIEQITDRLADQGNEEARLLANELLLAFHTPDPGSASSGLPLPLPSSHVTAPLTWFRVLRARLPADWQSLPLAASQSRLHAR